MRCNVTMFPVARANSEAAALSLPIIYRRPPLFHSHRSFHDSGPTLKRAARKERKDMKKERNKQRK
jgi:hypothetical protein